jgi:hypothetical protein
MLRGSCLCTQVQYEINGTIDGASHCHCSQCRKGHGAAFGSYGHVQCREFRFTQGVESVASYRASPSATRTFCVHCGSTLQWIPEGGDHFSIALGTLDDDPEIEIEQHIFVASKAPWYAITDTLPQFAAYPPSDPA